MDEEQSLTFPYLLLLVTCRVWLTKQVPHTSKSRLEEVEMLLLKRHFLVDYCVLNLWLLINLLFVVGDLLLNVKTLAPWLTAVV